MNGKRGTLPKPFMVLASIVFLLNLISAPPCALSWGVLSPAQTHQHIISEAYRLLAADSAFDPKLFPRLEDILAHEGVNWANLEYTGSGYGVIPDVSLIDGPGPDAKGNSPFSWHYYNPVTTEGNGPLAVGKYFRYLSEGMLTNKRTSVPQAAAWSAHFLADMHCPMHVVGMYKTSAQKLLKDQLEKHKGTKYEGSVYISDDIKGSDKLSYLSPIKSLSNNFRNDIERYLERGEDWFDPWYYNGTTPFVTQTSSHIAWETTVNPGPYSLSGYETTWKNGRSTFDKPVDIQADEASHLAVEAATLTRSKLEFFFDNPQPIINHAIRAVYTMWRASFSAMRPKIMIQEKEDGFHVMGNISNYANIAFGNVEMKLNISGCSLAGINAVQTVGTLPAKGILKGGEWKIEPKDASCKLKLQVIASCTAPDLLYAETETTVLNKKVADAEKKPVTPKVVETTPVAVAGVEGVWKMGTGTLMNQWTFSGGSGIWTTGGFSERDSMKFNFKYKLAGSTLSISGIPGTDIGDRSPYKITINGSKMVWQSIEIPAGHYEFTKIR
ncbi:MAG: hypothetical protein CSYNP_00971 [Syntrophus sp. SKADARSKE-3]|nr:hypothetical protein [Syntrophus sp. SKADARSKE-3]